MKFCDFSIIPPLATWRMYFAANAPEMGIVNISGNAYSKGLSDDGDQFFVQASTDSNGVPSYQYGTPGRNFSGGTTHPIVGNPHSLPLDQTNRNLTTRVST